MEQGFCYSAVTVVCSEAQEALVVSAFSSLPKSSRQGIDGRNVEQNKLDLTHWALHDHFDAANSKSKIDLEVQNQWFVLIISTRRSKGPLLKLLRPF